MSGSYFIGINLDLSREITGKPDLGKLIERARSVAEMKGSARVCSGMTVFDQFHSSEANLSVLVDHSGIAVRREDLPEFLKKPEHRERLLDQMDLLANFFGCTLVRKQLPGKELPHPELPL
jgi:hypothetical protein